MPNNPTSFRRLTAAEITPDTFNLKMYAYFQSIMTPGVEFLLPVAVMGYRDKLLKVHPVQAVIELPSEPADKGVWIPIADVWIEDKPVKKPRQYLKPTERGGEVMTIAEWTAAVNLGVFTELDGIGRWCKDGKEHSDEVFETSQEDATHVAWYPNYPHQ